MDAARFVEALKQAAGYEGQIRCVRVEPARPAVYGHLSTPLPRELQAVLEADGIRQLYSHQTEAIEAIRRGEHVVVVTGPASGKTLCYNIPILTSWLSHPETRALYLYPTKALAQDQLRTLQRYLERGVGFHFIAGTYDGDTPPDTRTRLRDQGHFILSNPDMLHAGILPNHTRWSEFFAHLRYVVVDEIHSYRGVFGSNVACVLRRLNRLCAHYGSQPQYICSSATIANPRELAEALLDRPVTLVDRDGAPRGPRRFVLWNPPFIDEGKVQRRSPNVEAQALMVQLLRERVQTIAFTRARVTAELLYRYVQDELTRLSPSLANAVRAYRGGYLPEERRQIERQLFSGELLGVTSTNALELGVDIGGLDACIMVGYPGSIASTWQQAGRAGRGSEEALIFLIAHNNPIDQYLVQHPDYFFGQSPENAIIDPTNSYILLGHLRCAAAELPLTREEVQQWGEYAPAILDILEEDGQVRRAGDRWYWNTSGYPAADISLRNMAGDTYSIVDTTGQSNQVIGTVDGFSAFTLIHTEAIYLHHGETYFVRELNLQQKVAYVEKMAVDYYTQAVTETKIVVEEKEEERPWRLSQTGFGEVMVTLFTLMFRKIKFYSLDSIGFGNLDLPPQPMETAAMWLIPPVSALRLVREFGRIPAEGMLGIANVLVDIVPLFVLCDYLDIGSVVDSSNFGSPSIFIYDRYPGGLGFAQKAYELLDDIMEACLLLIHECECEDGCPSCVGSTFRSFVHYDADSEARERIPDKEAALVILHHILEKEPYIPKPPTAERAAHVRREPEPPPVPIKRLPDRVEQKIRQRVQRLKRK